MKLKVIIIGNDSQIVIKAMKDNIDVPISITNLIIAH